MTNQTVGFYAGWPWSRYVPAVLLEVDGRWPQTADARLYSQNSDGSNQQTLATMTFHVEP